MEDEKKKALTVLGVAAVICCTLYVMKNNQQSGVVQTQSMQITPDSTPVSQNDDGMNCVLIGTEKVCSGGQKKSAKNDPFFNPGGGATGRNKAINLGKASGAREETEYTPQRQMSSEYRGAVTVNRKDYMRRKAASLSALVNGPEGNNLETFLSTMSVDEQMKFLEELTTEFDEMLLYMDERELDQVLLQLEKIQEKSAEN